MVGRADALKARRALNILVSDTIARSPGISRGVIRWAEYSNCWHLQCGCHMHRPGVVTDDQRAMCNDRHHLAYRRFTDQIKRLVPHLLDNILAYRLFTRPAYNDHLKPEFFRQSIGNLGEALGIPAFGGTISGTRIDTEPTPLAKTFECMFPFGGRDNKLKFTAASRDPKCFKHFQVMA